MTAAETAARALGLFVNRYATGTLVVTAYDPEHAAKLAEAGWRVEEHARFPGRKEPGRMWEATLLAGPEPETLDES